MENLQIALSMEPLSQVHRGLFHVRILEAKPLLDVLQVAKFDWSALLPS
jgi:hypothetical protein